MKTTKVAISPKAHNFNKKSNMEGEQTHLYSLSHLSHLTVTHFVVLIFPQSMEDTPEKQGKKKKKNKQTCACLKLADRMTSVRLSIHHQSLTKQWEA